MKKKEVEMICVSDLEGFDRELYESSKNKLKKHLSRFGWELKDCLLEEGDKVWACKAAAIWFLTPNIDANDWD
ncbi:MAG: hypothetical protein ACOY4H_06590 [Thermodesulfobacteriota bacterium]